MNTLGSCTILGLSEVSNEPKGLKGGLPWWLSGKESACQTGDFGLIPGSGRSPGEGNGSPHQYFCLENPMDRGTWRAPVHGHLTEALWSRVIECVCVVWGSWEGEELGGRAPESNHGLLGPFSLLTVVPVAAESFFLWLWASRVSEDAWAFFPLWYLKDWGVELERNKQISQTS